MLYTLVAVIVIVLAALIVFRAAKLLWLSDWFMGWLRGTFGLGLLALGLGVGFLAADIYSYRQVMLGQPVATISFEPIEEQYYNVSVVDVSGKTSRFQMHGDQWQMDVRLVRLSGYFSGFDLKPAYRLDSVSGRYYDIKKESADKRAANPINLSLLGIDWWSFVNNHPHWFSVIDANLGAARYLPMRPNASFEISVTEKGLAVRPLNAAASDSMPKVQ